MKCRTLAAKTSVAFIVLALLLLMTPESAYAVQPSQQYAKLFYSPYYVASMTQNQNTTFAFTIAPPDGFSGTQSAVLNFQVYAAPSVTFTLYVNNKACSPASFYISTSYAGASLLPFSFDCSNVVNHTGAYSVKLSPSKDTGAAYGWLDITYSNAPKSGDLEIHGTEYFPGDMATVFLQLVDGDDAPISNALCKMDIYAPASYNVSHPELLNDQNMLFKEEGLYYYDWNVPNSTGVYMVNAKCSKAESVRYHDSDQTILYPVIAVYTGSLDYGSNQSLNSYYDNAYVTVGASIGVTNMNVTFRNVTTTNASEASYNTFFQTTNARDMTLSVWNFTSGAFVPLTTFTSTGRGGGVIKEGMDEYRSFSISNSSGALFHYLRNQSMIFRMNTSGGAGVFDYNAIWLYATTFDYSYPPVLRGSGEIHVSTLNVTASVDFTPVTAAIVSSNATLHSALALNFSQVLGNETLIRGDISSVNSSIHSSLFGNFTEKDLAIESVNRTLHDSLFWNFTYTNAFINDTNTSIYNELMSLNFTGNLTEQINATLPTGFFTKMSNLAAGFWILVVVAILGALWWFFR